MKGSVFQKAVSVRPVKLSQKAGFTMIFHSVCVPVFMQMQMLARSGKQLSCCVLIANVAMTDSLSPAFWSCVLAEGDFSTVDSSAVVIVHQEMYERD